MRPAAAHLRGLYAITPDEPDETHLIEKVRSALTGGVRLLQFRDKSGDPARRQRLALALARLCRQFDACFIINDDPALAMRVNADGVHLGAEDGDLARVRRKLPAHMLLGASCYDDFERARAASLAGADYVAFGAVFPSPTKPQTVHAPLTLFTRCRHELDLPVCAIGGITLNNASEVIEAGAHMLAVISDLFGAADITGRAYSLTQLFKENTP